MTKEQWSLATQLYRHNRLDFSAYESYVLGISRRSNYPVRLFPIYYSSGKERLSVITSRTFGSEGTHSVAWRCLIHGEEGVTGVAAAINLLPMIELCQLLGLEWAFIVAGNPQGARSGERYSRDHVSGVIPGNDDLVRFLVNGRWVADAVNKKFTGFRPINPAIDRVAPEAVAMASLVNWWQEIGITKTLVGVLDLHADEMIRYGAYYYGYGAIWGKNVQRLFHQSFEKLTPMPARVVLSGAGDDGNGGDKIKINKHGLISDAHDGGWASAMALAGVPLSIAVEIASKEGLGKFVNTFGYIAQAWLLTARSTIPPV